MNLFVADPEWGVWIVAYFFLGGIAAGAYFTAALIQLVGGPGDRGLARAGYFIAFPLIALCGIFLIVDLHRPERFWHMLFKSEVATEAFHAGWPFSGHGWSLMSHALMFKYWSPMSVGSWALTFFGACSTLTFAGSLWPDRWIGRLVFSPVVGRMIAVLGCLAGFFIAAYTGTLLTATNQPVWSDSMWIAPLFLTSAGSTGIAAMILLIRWRGIAPSESVERLERADLWALGLELAVFAIFLASLGANLGVFASTWGGRVFLFAVPLLGLLAPLAIHLRLGMHGVRAEVAAASLALLGGLLLRYGLLAAPPELLRDGASHIARISPEDGRARGGGPGADRGNRTRPVKPRSKAYPGE
jgi:formate-dependent nitrite reductase membrane component NrfD